jgi:MFS family permease
MELTIEEAYPFRDRRKMWVVAVGLLLFIASGSSGLGIAAFHRPPPYPPVRHLPWQLAMFILWAVYVGLAAVIHCYIHIFLPLTPVTVEKSFRHIGLYFNIVLLGIMAILSLTVINHVGYTIACICINAVFLAGLLVFWRWIARKYRQVDLP